MKIALDPKQLPSVTFACGPSQGLEAVRQTPLHKTFFERSHRAADISTDGLYKQTTDNLRLLLGLPQDYTVIFFPGGATAALDAVVWNLTKDSISGLAFGAFSHLWNKKLATRLGPTVYPGSKGWVYLLPNTADAYVRTRRARHPGEFPLHEFDQDRA